MNFANTTFIAFWGLAFISCSPKNNAEPVPIENNTIVEEVAIVSMKNIEVTIEGMTCEIGCAKLIESKTYKLEGMSSSRVSFAHGIGQFSYDENKISVSEIEKHINGIAGGELYKVTSIKEVDEFSLLEEKTELAE